MILYMSYEEVRALRQGARSSLRDEPQGRCAVAAPPAARARAEVGALEEWLVGDLSVETLVQQRALSGALGAIVECLRIEMEVLVAATHRAHEGAVAAYFDYAHVLSVLGRLRERRNEMEAMIEVVTGRSAEGQTATTFQFPD